MHLHRVGARCPLKNGDWLRAAIKTLRKSSCCEVPVPFFNGLPGALQEPAEISQLLSQAAAGDRAALNDLFARHQELLWRMVRLRLNHRLQGRIDETDVVQEAFVEASRKIGQYLANPLAPFFLWLRQLTLLKLAELHRHHLGAEMRAAERNERSRSTAARSPRQLRFRSPPKTAGDADIAFSRGHAGREAEVFDA